MKMKKYFEDAIVELIAIDDEDILMVSGFEVSHEDTVSEDWNLYQQ